MKTRRLSLASLLLAVLFSGCSQGSSYSPSSGHVYAWAERINARSSNWKALAMSSDGGKIVAVGGVDIFISNDGGLNWTDLSASASPPMFGGWMGICSSSDGARLAACSGGVNNDHGGLINGDIWTSSDSGSSWTARGPHGYWSSITCSSDGSQLAACAWNGDLWTSVDYGATWTDRVSAGSRTWSSIASSSDGKTLAACVGGNYAGMLTDNLMSGDIYISKDGGVTWVDVAAAGTKYWFSISSSADGSGLVACTSGGDIGNNGEIFTSSDGGLTWLDRAHAGSRQWWSVSSSSDGTILAASANPGDIYVSADRGSTWTDQTAATGQYWNSVVIAADGSRIAACYSPGEQIAGIYIGNY